MNHHELLKRAAAVGALTAAIGASGVIGLTAATANALPISNLQSECRGGGGSWHVEYSSGAVRQVTGYQCWYKDISGDQYVDFYDRRGNYTGTS
jgi:hypothetical protein